METEIENMNEKPRIVGMIWSPAEQFDRIRQTPKIWLPLILISLIYAVGMTTMAFTMDAAYLGLEDMGDAETAMILMITRVTMAIMGIFTPVFIILISSAIYMIVVKIAGSDAKFKHIFSMNTYIFIIGGIGLILNMAIRLAIGGNPEVFVTSLASLAGSDKSGVLGSIEVFSIWQTVLTAIGLHRVAGLSKGWAWTVAIIFFLIGLGIAYITTLFTGIAGV